MERVTKSPGICSDCQGTGWLLENRDTTAVAVACPRCRSEARTRRLLENAAIPPRYVDRGFEVYSIHHPLQEKALKRCVEFVDEFPSGERGLLLVGPCGVGKTHLSVAILKTLVTEKGVEGRFVDETELLRRLQYSYSANSPETEREVLSPLMEAALLVWDDLGRGRPTEWVQETIRTVINYRYTYRKKTIFTTNRALKPAGGKNWKAKLAEEQISLAERIGQHLWSRIMEMCEVVTVDGPDARTAIHKAGMDFRKTSSSRSTLRKTNPDVQVPEGLVQCPKCQSPGVQRLDSSAVKGARSSPYVELSCFCPGCDLHFLARFFVKSASLVYPSPKS